MKRREHIVQVLFKPNCGLENTRASLVMRRIAPLCTTVWCHPPSVKSDQGTIGYLCDHGLFIRFQSAVPEQVMLAIKGSFFVDRCVLVDDPDSIPPFSADDSETRGENRVGTDGSPFADSDARNGRDDDLTNLVSRFEDAHRALRAHADRHPHDHALNDILFAHAQAVDSLRTVVERSRIEPFDGIVASLHMLVSDYSKRFGKTVRLEVEEGRVALDRSVLATMEEALKRVLRLSVRDGIESPKQRAAAGKPECATIRLHAENDGSDVVCRIEHDGHPFDAKLAGKAAFERGLLTRPIDTYTDEEIGSFLLLPRFGVAGVGPMNKPLSELGEIGAMLQHAGGHGEVHNTAQGALEIALHFPVPFTVLEVALLRAGETHFALPAQQIRRFEAFNHDQVELASSTSVGADAHRAFYVDEEGERHELINGRKTSSPLDAVRPLFVLLLEVLGAKHALAVDAVDGYERVTVSQLPPLINRSTARSMGCIGYAMLGSGEPCVVINARRLLNARNIQGGRHA